MSSSFSLFFLSLFSLLEGAPRAGAQKPERQPAAPRVEAFRRGASIKPAFVPVIAIQFPIPCSALFSQVDK
jgi:hypothetical protein